MPTSTRLSDWFVQAMQVILVAVIAVLVAAVLLTVLQSLGYLHLDIVSKLSTLSSAGGVLQF